MYLNDIFTVTVNMAGCPAFRCRPAFVKEGLRSGCSSSAGRSTRRPCCAWATSSSRLAARSPRRLTGGATPLPSRKANDCSNMEEVRAEIDRLDGAIVDLVASGSALSTERGS